MGMDAATIMNKSFNKIVTDDERFIEIYSSTYENVLQHALQYGSENNWAEDIVHEVFIKLWLKKDELATISNLNGYLYILTRNNSIQYLRKQKSDRKKRLEYDYNRSYHYNHDLLQDKEYRQLREKAIHRLPEQQQTVYLLKTEYNLERLEIARKLKLSPYTVTQHYKKARKAVGLFMQKAVAA